MDLFVSLKQKLASMCLMREVYFYKTLINLVQSFCFEFTMLV